MARGMAVGVPVWIVLLFVFPEALGFGVLSSLTLATVLAVAITETVERTLLRPVLARRRGEPGDGDGGVARAGRAFAIGIIAWGLLVVIVAQSGVTDNAWVAFLVPLALAVAIVEIVERAIVRPWQRRRGARG